MVQLETTKNGPELRGDFHGTVPHETCNRLQDDSPESYHIVYTLQSCYGAVVAPLSEVPHEGSTVSPLLL